MDRHHETQEQSIKARKHQLFEADETAAVGSGRPFKDFLRTTPAAPLSGPTKAALWGVTVVVVLVLIATLVKTFHRPPKAAPRPAARSARLGEPPGGRGGLASLGSPPMPWDLRQRVGGSATISRTSTRSNSARMRVGESAL